MTDFVTNIPVPRMLKHRVGKKTGRKNRPVRVPKQTTGLKGQINSWMTEAFTKMGAPDLSGSVPWTFNKRLTSSRGKAGCVWKEGIATNLFMEFSPALFKASDDEGKRQCVFHECAHIVDYHLGTYVKSRPHGPSWERLMTMANVKAERCHKIEVKKRRVKKYKASCNCQTWSLSAQKRHKIKRGESNYSCPKCGTILRLER